jgi:hypothetical protein
LNHTTRFRGRGLDNDIAWHNVRAHPLLVRLASLPLRLWGLACTAPLLVVLHETVLGVVPGPIANTSGQGALVLRRAPSRGQAIVYLNPLAPGRHASGRVAAVPGERGLRSGQLWVECEGAAGAELDSRHFGALPAPLVAGTPLLFFPSPFSAQ